MVKVNPKDAQLVNEHLVQCLRDSVMVQNQTQIVHWGLLGSKFYQIHLLTGDIQTEMVEGIDNIAEHIRSINIMTPVSVVDLLSDSFPGSSSSTFSITKDSSTCSSGGGSVPSLWVGANSGNGDTEGGSLTTKESNDFTKFVKGCLKYNFDELLEKEINKKIK